MLRLNISNGSEWFDMGHGVRLKLAPLNSAVMLAARKDPEVLALSEEQDDGAVALTAAKYVARAVLEEWEGVGDEDGNPAPVTPEGISALLDLWPIFDAFQTRYLSGGMLLEQEKNGSSPLPNGSSAGATDTAKPARKSAKTARAK